MTKISRSIIIDSLIRNDIATLADEPRITIITYLSDILLVGIKGYDYFTYEELEKKYYERFDCRKND